MVSFESYLTLSAALFVLGIAGFFLNRRNLVTMLISIELLLLAATINLVGFSAASGDLNGQVFSIFVMTVASAQAVIGAVILIGFYRSRGMIRSDRMKG